MAPNTSARNASPAPRAAKKNEGSKENASQNQIQNEHEQPSAKLQSTLKEIVSQIPMQNENEQEPRKQGALATLKNKSASTVRAAVRSLASTCCSGRALVSNVFERSKTSRVEAVSSISQPRKVFVAALMMVLTACVAFLIVYSSDCVREFAASMQNVTSHAWSLTSPGLGGLASQGSEAPADL
eukprot:TRINITY_DN123_c0_g1_i1.p1 TRINITY_DN123_c0_g1~~TRINITY_DN123_c0_g1_i1.p1  ORF type:complete len:184 (-),score=36.42 TRINITY_DN123_c0_g1_i1:362-913(-)